MRKGPRFSLDFVTSVNSFVMSFWSQLQFKVFYENWSKWSFRWVLCSSTLFSTSGSQKPRNRQPWCQTQGSDDITVGLHLSWVQLWKYEQEPACVCTSGWIQDRYEELLKDGKRQNQHSLPSADPGSVLSINLYIYKHLLSVPSCGLRRWRMRFGHRSNQISPQLQSVCLCHIWVVRVEILGERCLESQWNSSQDAKLLRHSSSAQSV